MINHVSETIFAPLEAEISNWIDAGKRIRLFLRDDDAVEITDNLIRLAALLQNSEIPALIAVIPGPAQPELAGFFERYPLLTPAQHGIDHLNHADASSKKCELGDDRPLQQTLEELSSARSQLVSLFGARLSPALVPPWNRISEDVAARAGDLGFQYISGFSWKEPENNLPWLNTHVDIIDWKNGKISKPLIQVVQELAENLTKARENGHRPVGLLTHHLDHDDQCWDMLERLFTYLDEQPFIQFEKADDLVMR